MPNRSSLSSSRPQKLQNCSSISGRSDQNQSTADAYLNTGPPEVKSLQEEIADKLSVRELVKREVNKKTGDLKSYQEMVKKKQAKMSKFWLKPVEFDHVGTSQLIKKKFNDYIKHRENIRSLLEEPSNRQELTRQVLAHVN